MDIILLLKKKEQKTKKKKETSGVLYSLGPRLTASGPRRRLAFVVHRTSCPAPALPVCPPSVWSCLSLRITVYPVHQLAYDQRHLLHSSYVAGKKKQPPPEEAGTILLLQKKTGCTVFLRLTVSLLCLAPD